MLIAGTDKLQGGERGDIAARQRKSFHPGLAVRPVLPVDGDGDDCAIDDAHLEFVLNLATRRQGLDEHRSGIDIDHMEPAWLGVAGVVVRADKQVSLRSLKHGIVGWETQASEFLRSAQIRQINAGQHRLTVPTASRAIL